MSAQKRDWQQQQREVAPRNLVTRAIAGLIITLSPVQGEPATPPDDIADALERLGADSYAERERASHDLWQAGKPAEPYLEQALGHPSIEVRARARRVLQLLRFGLDANASPEHWAFIGEFHSSQPEHQATLLYQMLGRGESQLALRLLDGSGASRMRLLAQLDGQLERMLPRILITGDIEQARRLVDLLASGGHRLRYAAWFHHLSGTADDAAARLAALTSPDVIARKRLYHLANARGDADTATEIAKTLGLSEDERSFGLGDATPVEFAKRSAKATRDQVETLGFLAAHARLTGDKKSFDEHIAGLRRAARLNRKERPFCLEAMIINGAIDAAIESAATAIEPFRIHARQWKVGAALQSLGIIAQAPPFSPWIENLCARIESTRRLKAREELLAYPYALADLCIQTGEQNEAERVCRLTAKSLLKADRLGFHRAIRHETALGLKKLAMEHAQQALDIGTPEISVFLGLYGKSNQHARNWFDYLRKRGGDKATKPEERLKMLDLLLTRSAPDSAHRAAATPLVSEALTVENPLRGARKSTWATTLAYTASLHGIPQPVGFTVALATNRSLPMPVKANGSELPMATRVLGRPESVLSPYGISWIVDVTGKAPGSVVKCPFSQKDFVVPPPLENASPLRPRSNIDIRALRDAGESHLAADRFEEAAKAFKQAVDASGNEAAPQLLFLLGEALIRAGDHDAGTRRQRQARLLAPLTSDRLGFIEFLWELGKIDTVAEECRFLYLDDQPRITAVDGRVFGIVARFLAQSDPLRAADLWEMQLLTALRKQEGSTLTKHLEARFLIHLTRARGLQEFGDLSASLEEIRMASAMLPADARLAEAIAPLLHSATLKNEAATILTGVDAAASAAAAQFPDSAMLRENHERVRMLMPKPITQ